MKFDPRLDELPHTTDKYSLKVRYAKGPYAVVELYDLDRGLGRDVASRYNGWRISRRLGGYL